MSSLSENGLRDYLAVLRRRWWIVASATVVGIVGALLLSAVQTPLYASTSRILVAQQSSSALFDPNTGQALKTDLATEVELQLLTSQRVREEAEQRLGRPANVRATVGGSGTVLIVRAVDADPDRAAEEANVLARSYLDVRRENAVNDFSATAKAVQDKMGDLNADLTAVTTQLAAADAAGDIAQVAQLRRQETSLTTQLDNFQQQVDQLTLSANLAEGGGPTVIAEGKAANNPFRPTPVRNAMLGGLAGLLVGLGLAFLVDHLDDSIRNKDDLETATGGLATLALVPRLPGWRNRTEPVLASLEDPNGPPAEAYRALRTSVQFMGIERRLRVLQVTSPRAQDGKTTTICNLAVAFARAGLRVILVDCDLRRPRVHQFVGLDNSVGFTSILLDQVKLEDALRPTQQKGLVVLAAGPIPPAPSELLSTKRAATLIERLADHCDLLLIDSPPVLPVSDPLVLSEHVDGVVLVSAAGNTSRREVARAVELLQQVEAPLLGTVLNLASSAVGYGYQYGYGPQEREVKPDGRWFGRGGGARDDGGEDAGDEEPDTH